jgi:hypothetical protein
MGRLGGAGGLGGVGAAAVGAAGWGVTLGASRCGADSVWAW